MPPALLARAQAGQRQALEQIYRCFERPVFNLALRIVGERGEASEILQDTMLKVIDHIAAFRGGAPFWGWLRQIAVNEALMHLRRGRRQSLEHTGDDEQARPAGSRVNVDYLRDRKPASTQVTVPKPFAWPVAPRAPMPPPPAVAPSPPSAMNDIGLAPIEGLVLALAPLSSIDSDSAGNAATY